MSKSNKIYWGIAAGVMLAVALLQMDIDRSEPDRIATRAAELQAENPGMSYEIAAEVARQLVHPAPPSAELEARQRQREADIETVNQEIINCNLDGC